MRNLDFDETAKLYDEATELVANGNHVKALEILEDLIFAHKQAEDSSILHNDQGYILLELAKIQENPDLKFAYRLGSVECFENAGISPLSACSLCFLAQELESVMYAKKCLSKAREGLQLTNSSCSDIKERDGNVKEIMTIIGKAEFIIAESEASSTKKCELLTDLESKKSPEPPLKHEYKGLRSYWLGLDVKMKRDFMKVSVANLLRFVEGVEHYKAEGRDALEQVLASAREDSKWTFWMCRTKCLKKFSSAEECRNHFEQEHAADFKISSQKGKVMRIGKDWARKISVGSWEPVDAVAAVEMIKNRLADVKAFASKNGWSKEWPIAVDEERSKLLKEVKLLLVSFCNRKILSCSIRDWVMRYPLEHLGKLGVSEQNLVDYHIVETPQSICFLECHELNQILGFLKTIKCERDDGTDLVCRAVDSVLARTQVKEKIDFDPQYSYLLLDKRLLKNNDAPFDDEGTIKVYNPSVYYAKAHAHGDDIISWLTDYNSVDKTFPRPIREHNFSIWVAVLKAVQFTCRTLGAKYAKKVQFLIFDTALNVVEKFCTIEDERRRNLPEDQWSLYSSLVCDFCEKEVSEDSFPTKLLFLCAIRDILEGALHPTFDSPDIEDCLNLIRERKTLSDNKVLKSVCLLKSVVTQKILLMDSKFLLIDNSRIRLLNSLKRLSAFG
ncbi:PREDICTED: uncharacterized protein LOC109127153, partial [Camelina sativa]|uniref:Uncharacterized protein LOC109127153 n=1 Tax=Camelina sativa TaxID=90675 RepID=A0ABM1QJS0_CAMSA